MADINVEVAHGKDDVAGVQAGVAKILDKMSAKMGFDVNWDGNTATMSGTGVKNGTVQVDDANITIEINLAMMAKPMKGMIQKMIQESFEKHLG